MAPDRSGDLGSIVGIWAHPDDEAWLASGVMMRAVEAGHRVVCVTATRGEAGFPPDDTRSLEERTAVREGELADCLAILGVTEHRYLGYGDGQCADASDDEAIDQLGTILDEVRPTTVLSFGPDGATGHADHISTCRWTTEAVAKAAMPDMRLLYATTTRHWVETFFSDVDPSTVNMIEGFERELLQEDELAVWFSCDDEHLARKVAAMRAQVSQIEEIAQQLGLEKFAATIREEFFREPRPSDADAIARMTAFWRP